MVFAGIEVLFLLFEAGYFDLDYAHILEKLLLLLIYPLQLPIHHRLPHLHLHQLIQRLATLLLQTQFLLVIFRPDCLELSSTVRRKFCLEIIQLITTIVSDGDRL